MFKHIILALERIEERQKRILERLEAAGPVCTPSGTDPWLERGIDNILSYQVGRKGGEEE